MTTAIRQVMALAAGVLLALACFMWQLHRTTGGPLHVAAILIGVLAVVIAILIALDLGTAGDRANATNRRRILLIGQIVGVAVFVLTASTVSRLNGESRFWALVVGATAVAVVVAWHARSRSVAAFAATLVVVTLVLLAVLTSRPTDETPIDVAVFQSEAARALVGGGNPYSLRLENPYATVEWQRFYDESLVREGRLQFGFPYLPLSLLVVTPFEIFLGDFRAAHVLALIGSAVIIAALRPGPLGRDAAVVWLLLASVPYVVDAGWTEPLVILSTLGVILASVRDSRSAPFLVGAAVAVKQYMVVMIPTSLLLVERPWTDRRVPTFLVRVLSVPVATIIPFLLWHPGNFVGATVMVQLVQPFRPDSLSLPALFAHAAGTPPSNTVVALQMIATLGVLTACLWRSSTGAFGFTLSSAAVFGTFFILSRQAFPNYFLLVVSLLIAASVLPLNSEEPRQRDAPPATVPG